MAAVSQAQRLCSRPVVLPRRCNSSGSSHVQLGGRSVAPYRPSKPSRQTVQVEANLFSRIARIVSGTANNLVSSAEDPEKILDQVVVEMQDDLIKMRQATAQVMASQKQLEAKVKNAQETADEWLRKAELAVAKGEDELAREALKRRKAFQETADQLNVQLEAQKNAVEQLLGNARLLESKLAEAKMKKETLKARAASAKTSRDIQDALSGLSTSSALGAFEKMEQKLAVSFGAAGIKNSHSVADVDSMLPVIAMEAEAESVRLLSPGGNDIDRKFAALEGGTVDDDLAALKRGMIGSGSSAKQPVGALPEGRPVTDAIDMELEALRKKARE